MTTKIDEENQTDMIRELEQIDMEERLVRAWISGFIAATQEKIEGQRLRKLIELKAEQEAIAEQWR